MTSQGRSTSSKAATGDSVDDASKKEIQDAIADVRGVLESDDPAEETAATRCDCTGRTIRNRLTRAATKLARFKEDL